MDEFVDQEGQARPERRKHVELRPLFDDVVRRVEPFFQEDAKLNGSRTDFWVVRAICDAYPQLSNEDAHVLARAAIRYHQERK